MLWSHLEFFLATARHGTLSAAAKELNVNHTTVARRISALEKELQIKLNLRSIRQRKIKLKSNLNLEKQTHLKVD